MPFLKGHMGFRTKESYKNADKSFFNTEEYKEKQRIKTTERHEKGWNPHLGKKTPDYVREKISKSLKGHPPWSMVDFPTYSALHKWLRSEFGRPSKCEMCNCKPSETKRFEYALKHGKIHSRNIVNYISLCVSCHRKYDRKEHESLFGDKYRFILEK